MTGDRGSGRVPVVMVVMDRLVMVVGRGWGCWGQSLGGELERKPRHRLGVDQLGGRGWRREVGRQARVLRCPLMLLLGDLVGLPRYRRVDDVLREEVGPDPGHRLGGGREWRVRCPLSAVPGLRLRHRWRPGNPIAGPLRLLSLS